MTPIASPATGSAAGLPLRSKNWAAPFPRLPLPVLPPRAMSGSTPLNSHQTYGIPSPSVTSTNRLSDSNIRNATVQSVHCFARESTGLKSFPETTSGKSATRCVPPASGFVG